MPRTTYFVQTCPTCGRPLQVRVEYLGKSVRCPHCGVSCDASDPSMPDGRGHAMSDSLLARADELLASAERFGYSDDELPDQPENSVRPWM